MGFSPQIYNEQLADLQSKLGGAEAELKKLEAQRNLKNILLSTASFYHGLVPGMVAQENEYHITSNRESGIGRYDVMLKPLKKNLPSIIIEF